MSKNGFLSRFTNGSSAQEEAPSSPIAKSDMRRRLELLDNFEDLEIGWFWATDPSGSLIYLSESAARALGCEPEQIVG